MVPRAGYATLAEKMDAFKAGQEWAVAHLREDRGEPETTQLMTKVYQEFQQDSSPTSDTMSARPRGSQIPSAPTLSCEAQQEDA